MKHGVFPDEMPVPVVPTGSAVFSPTSWHHLAASLRLSPREFEIVRHIFDDHKELAIGQALGISSHTVNTYLQRLYHKLHVSSREQLIVRLIAEHLAHAVGQTAPGGAAGGSVEPGLPLHVHGPFAGSAPDA